MFLTCQVDLPVASTIKSAQSRFFGTAITFTLSALTSVRTFCISWRSRRPPLLVDEAEVVRLRPRSPCLQGWRNGKDEWEVDEESRERDRRAALILVGDEAKPGNRKPFALRGRGLGVYTDGVVWYTISMSHDACDAAWCAKPEALWTAIFLFWNPN